MGYTKKQKRGIVIVNIGARACLLLTAGWIVNAIYWRSVTGSWLDPHITAYEIAPVFCIAGVFFFTRIVSKFFDLQGRRDARAAFTRNESPGPGHSKRYGPASRVAVGNQSGPAHDERKRRMANETKITIVLERESICGNWHLESLVEWSPKNRRHQHFVGDYDDMTNRALYELQKECSLIREDSKV